MLERLITIILVGYILLAVFGPVLLTGKLL